MRTTTSTTDTFRVGTRNVKPLYRGVKAKVSNEKTWQREEIIPKFSVERVDLADGLAAPVYEGMMLLTLSPPRQSLCDGPSTVFRVAVMAWTVVIRPSTIPKLA
jgi:hypothetical protein